MKIHLKERPSISVNAREVFKGQVVLSKDGECIVNNVSSLEIIGEDGKITKPLRLSSIIFDIFCPTLVSLTNFWDKYQSGVLHSQLYSDLNVDHFKQKFNLPNLKLTVKIPAESYQICKAQMEKKLGKYMNLFFKYFIMITILESEVGECV